MTQSGPAQAHRVTHPGPGSVNTWLIEGEHSLVAVDCQRTPSDAAAVVKRVEEIGKPLAAVLVTHGHPDHVLGLSGILEAVGSSLRVLASQRTIDLVASDVYGYVGLTRRAVREPLPEPVPLPTEHVRHNQRLSIDGIDIRVLELGPGECEAMTAFEFPELDVIAAGDLVEHEMTPFLLEARSGEWLRQLKRARELVRCGTMLPGHGVSGETTRLLDWQAEYLGAMRQAVRLAHSEAAEATEEAASAVVDRVRGRYGVLDPVALIPELERLNAVAVHAELYAD